MVICIAQNLTYWTFLKLGVDIGQIVQVWPRSYVYHVGYLEKLSLKCLSRYMYLVFLPSHYSFWNLSTRWEKSYFGIKMRSQGES